jgi:hypothetical protein
MTMTFQRRCFIGTLRNKTSSRGVINKLTVRSFVLVTYKDEENAYCEFRKDTLTRYYGEQNNGDCTADAALGGDLYT